jgi:hypothetical protein
MKRYFMISLTALSLALLITGTTSALSGKPDFNPHIYADGSAWGTKVTATFKKGPNAHNEKSFDKFFVIVNSNNPDTQLPVGEAGPGNPMYNGGRWWTQTVMWTQAGFDYYGIVPILMSYEEIMSHAEMGQLEIIPGSFEGGPPPYFDCPLLPVK